MDILIPLIICLIVCLAFAAIIVLIIALVAFKYGKPTTNDHGPVYYHNFGQEEKEESKIINNEKFLLAAQCLGEILKSLRQDKDEKPPRNKRSLKK